MNPIVITVLIVAYTAAVLYCGHRWGKVASEKIASERDRLKQEVAQLRARLGGTIAGSK